MTLGQLIAFDSDLAPFADALMMRAASISLNTDLRWAHFLSQVAHESSGFKRIVENLNYSAGGLLATFPKYFKTASDAALFARQPERIANRVYANRLGNGPEESGDGWRYRGRGLIQITGRDNYRACSVSIWADDRLLRAPELLEEPDGAVASACWYWRSRELNALADQDDLEAITRKVNGGLHGLDDHDRSDLDTRMDWLVRAKTVFGIA